MTSSDDFLNGEPKELVQMVLNEFPYQIAKNYRELLDLKTWEKRTEKALLIFEFTLRILSLVLVSQYLVHDRDKDISDQKLNDLLRFKLPKPSLGVWVEIIFSILKMYGEKDQNLFISEFYTDYWDDRKNTIKKGVRGPFQRLVEIRNRIAHGLPPKYEEDWELLFNETIENLNKVFTSIAFIRNYQLIKSSLGEDGQFVFHLYKGMDVRELSFLVNASGTIDEGWFYLSRKTEGQSLNSIKLFPFLVALEHEMDPIPEEGIQFDAGLLERFTSKTVYYTAPIFWETFGIDDIVHLEHFNYYFNGGLDEKIKKSKLILWDIVLDSAQKISHERMSDVIEKYNPDLYLQRDEVTQVFDNFLESDKTCLVLTGKSGVGKSNFVLSLSDLYQVDQKVCFLLYNGAKNLFDDTGLSELVLADFNRYIELAELSQKQNLNIWQILDQVPEIRDSYLVIIIDAINESADPKTVLRKIDAVIKENQYPWLKVVLTSRPEAWRTLSSRVPLAEQKYYWSAGHEDMGVEIQEFKLLEEEELPFVIDQFSKDELQSVYEKYQNFYQLKTDFDDLPYSVKSALRDPLILKLVSVIYQEKEIPPNIMVSEIYTDYVNYLQLTGRLEKKDLFFLETKIVDMMVQNLINALPDDMIFKDEDLFEKIYNEDLLENGLPVNHSFGNLVDAEILGPVTGLGESSVSFKYERFYEVYSGKGFYQIFKALSDPIDYIESVVEIANQKPFLLGMIKNGLLCELKDGETKAVMGLAGSSFALSRDLVTSVLTRYGQLNLAHTKELLNQLYVDDSEQDELDDKEIFQSMVAVDVAGNLFVSEILQKGIRSKYNVIRSSSVWETYNFWVQDRSEGWQILEGLMDEIIQIVRFLPLAWNVILKKARFDYIEAAGFISIHILTNHFNEEDVGKKLRNIWRPVIEQVLFYQENDSLRNRINNFLRETILSSLINVIVGRLSTIPGRYNPAGLAEFDAYYDLPFSVKEKFNGLVDYLDPEFGTLDEFEALIMDLYPTNNGLISMIMGHLMLAQSRRDLPEVLEMAERIFDYGVQKPTPGIFSGNMLWVTGTMSRIFYPENDQVFSVVRDLTRKSVEKVRLWQGSVRAYANVWIDDYAKIFVDHFGNPRVELVLWYAEKLVKEKDFEALEDFVFILGRIASTPKYWKVVMEAFTVLAPLNFEDVEIKKNPHAEKIAEMMVDLLSLIRSHNPEYVDEFLEKYFSQSEIRQRVLVKKAQEDIFGALGGGTGPWVAFSVKVIHTEENRADFQWLLKTMVTSDNFNYALKMLVKWSINKIYGGAVFILPKSK